MLGSVPQHCPPMEWDVLWLTQGATLGSLRKRFLRTEAVSLYKRGARRFWRRTAEAWRHERAGTAAGNRRLLPPQRTCGIDLWPPRRQRRQARPTAAQW